MTTQESISISAPVDEAELRAFAAFPEHAFASNPSPNPDISWLQRQGIENFRVVRVRGRIVGGLGIIPMGQWFGGKSVKMVGIDAVAIAPEYRSTGIASRLLRSMLEEVRDQGFPISTLYPATQPVYRRAGYEQAGVSVRYQQPAHALTPRDRSLEVRPLEDGEESIMHSLYSERARRTAGNLDRAPMMWEEMLQSKDAVINKYVVERDGTPEGYLVYHQAQRPGQQERNIIARDLVALTPDAGRRLLSLLADHRSVVSNVVWSGPPAEPLLFHMANQDYKIVHYDQWMLRLIDVRRALESRGYPQALSTEVHLEVHDDLLGWNNGRIVLTVSEGRAEVREGGEGRVRVDVRSLASIYSGYLTPQEMLSASGHIVGREADLAAIGLVFSGPVPWMPDHF